MVTVHRPDFLALVLAGGRSSRLHASSPAVSPDKPLLKNGDRTLLSVVLSELEEHTSAGPCESVVVGPDDLPVPQASIVVREDPPFSGPAAAIRTGLRALAERGHANVRGTWVFLVASDMPRSGPGLAALARAVESGPEEASAYIGSDSGRLQPLLSVVRFEAALEAFDGTPADASVMSRLKRLGPVAVEVPDGASADVDTWEDAVAHGFTAMSEGSDR
ncbi:molybdenum cofactor guanylyltransferase [Rothia uropygialis]|uniref:molybdenum cofactor guanylyltransferase n=1 Tax=Kocuria sp. 36 TaxID=1415402 RepID=UPI00101CFE7E|nr:NTP transferase domain-containing protein [Kocuria sp. 36]